LPTTRRSLSWGSRLGSFVCRPGHDVLVRRDAHVEPSFEGPGVLPDRPSPDTSVPGSFFLDDGPLQSSFARLPPADLSAADATYQGSSPIRDITDGVHPKGTALPFRSSAERVSRLSLRSVLRLSQPLDGLLRHSASRACSIPQPRPGFDLSRGFSPRAARALSSSDAAPLSLNLQRSPVRRRWPR
jgi:hypothetical protein